MNEEMLIQAVENAHKLIEQHYGEYLIDSPADPKGKPTIEVDDSEMWVWEQIGKLYIARADWYFAQLIKGQTSDNTGLLKMAVGDYAYALEHNGYGRSGESYHLKRAKERLADRVEGLPKDAQQMLNELLKDWEEKYLAMSTKSKMRDFLEDNALL